MSKRRKPSPLPPDFVGAPPERIARGEVVVEEFLLEGARGIRKRHRVDRLKRYLAHGVISKEQYAAGHQFAADAELSQISTPSFLDMSRFGVGAPELYATKAGLRANMAYRRVAAAIQAMGIVNSRAVIAVCLTNTPADEWARAARFKRDDGATGLRMGLQALVIHYGLDNSPGKVYPA